MDYPTLLDLPAPRLLGYSRESAIAEKFEAMVKLGTLNSRMKDFFDIWLLSRQFEFNGRTCRTRFGKPSPIGKRKFPCRLLRSLKHFPMIPRRFCNGGHSSGNPVSLRSRNPSRTSSHTSRFFLVRWRRLYPGKIRFSGIGALLAPGSPGNIAKGEPIRKGATALGRNHLI